MSSDSKGEKEPIPARLLDLGRMDYQAAWERQLALVAERQRGEGQDTLILVEHPHVITLGRRRDAQRNILQPPGEGAIPVVEVERGGDVTYHGPGQLVGYPILRLDGQERDLHRYLRVLEDGLIATVTALGLPCDRRPGATGVWSGDKKLASIGIAVRRWVCYHGFALNVSTDLGRFAAINPCGYEANIMTSLEALLGRPVSLEAVKPALVQALGESLGRRFEPAPVPA